MSGRREKSVIARLAVDAGTARRLSDALAERLVSGDTAVAAYEEGGGWLIEIHFGRAPDEGAVRALIGELAGAPLSERVIFVTVLARDWVAASLAGLAPVAAGRFFVHGSHDRYRVPPNRIGIEIEAALAFGTGHHGTTSGCLMALDRIVKARRAPHVRHRGGGPGRGGPGGGGHGGGTGGGRGGRGGRSEGPGGAGCRGSARPILDIGTGSGVLAIAAALALRRPALACDIDPVSVRVARDNARLNRAGGLVKVVRANGVGDRRFRAAAPFAIAFANILLAPLKLMAGPLACLAAPGARLILSGLLPGQANAALAAYRAHGLVLERRILIDGWATLVLARPVKKPTYAAHCLRWPML
jgi:ribosomal protein L11 methyltransferase